MTPFKKYSLESLENAWDELMRSFGIEPDGASCCLDFIINKYSEPGRYYHNLEHVWNMVQGVFMQYYRAGGGDSRRTEIAAWFHDVIYVPGAVDNESKSAIEAERFILEHGLNKNMIDEVCTLIELTKNHRLDENSPLSAKILCDCDLYGLGTSLSSYLRNGFKIREEFAAFSDAQWAAGRRAFIEGMLARDRIFWTDPFRKLESQARENLKFDLFLLEKEARSQGVEV